MKRPYLSKSLMEIQSVFESNRYDRDVLKIIAFELSHRKTRGARKLATEISNILDNEDTAQIEISEQSNDYISCDLIDEQPAGQELINIEEILPSDWDNEQRTIIEYDNNYNMVVEAGPGAGKTAVACARVAYLIERCDLEASKIFLISFTRAAVKEIRDRIEAFAENPVNITGLQIMTLDSFTWHVVKGMGFKEGEELFTSYEGNIEKFLEQLKDKNKNHDLLDYLSEFQHVIVDEGQDLVSIRAELIVEILKKIPDSCGVTVFSDSAQAIYGFTDDSEQHGTHNSLTAVERIEKGDVNGFKHHSLENVHRTKDPKLKKLFARGRKRLLNRKKGSIETWVEMKDLVKSFAHGEIASIQKQDLKNKIDHLVLYRTRAEVLMESSFLWNTDTSHKIRMSNIPSRIHPWIGWLFAEVSEDFLSKERFEDLWIERNKDSNVNSKITREKAWELLFDNVGDSSGRLRLIKLREILSRDRPPLDFIVEEKELPGPVLGTIHASKGREANQVYLMLPPDRYMESDYEIDPHEYAEEERVIFVGATRARKALYIGKGKKLFASKLESGRVFRRIANKKCAQVEIGLKSDLFYPSIANESRNLSEVKDLQSWLWSKNKEIVNIYSQYEHKSGVNQLYVEDEDRYIGSLNKKVGSDLFTIAEKIGNQLKPSPKIKHLRMIGVTTVVIPEGQRDSLNLPWRQSGFLLAPVITGFTTVYFNNR